MAFDLRPNNLTGLSVITDTGSSLRQLPENFTTLYDYASQYAPELVAELMYANGKGSILGFIRATTGGKESTYESDTIQYAELARLHNLLLGVTNVGNVFTSPGPHNLRVNDVIKLSDGDAEYQAVVSAVGPGGVNSVTFTALNDATGAFALTGDITVLADFSSRFLKGDEAFTKGKKWDPTMKINYSHIMKEYYEVSDSDLAQKTWIETPEGPRWFNLEMERTSTLFDNQTELTAVLHERATDASASAAAGFAQGLKGVVQQIEEGGNVANDYIDSIAALYAIAFRLKQNGDVREVTVWCDDNQMRLFNTFSAGVNASFVNGANYGAFNNSKDMAINLDFSTIHLSGVTFHFVSWALLDNPNLLGAVNFTTTSIAYLIVPTGTAATQENGMTMQRPHLDIRFRTNNLVNRRKQTKFFGTLGTPISQDKSSVEYLSEMTNQVVGVNSFFVGRKGTFYS